MYWRFSYHKEVLEVYSDEVKKKRIESVCSIILLSQFCWIPSLVANIIVRMVHRPPRNYPSTVLPVLLYVIRSTVDFEGVKINYWRFTEFMY
jgi:small neutral amino acid transporter SnatA (MarC family)